MSDAAGAGVTSPAVTSTSTSSAAPQAPTSPAPNAFPERVKVKIEGAEREVSFEDLVKDYQLKEASNRRFQEASALAKKAGPVLEALEKGDLRKLMESIPKDQFRQFAEDFLIGEVEYEQLPDYEKRRIQAEMRASELEKQLKDLNEDKTKAQQERELAEAGVQVDNEITAVLDKMGKKPTPYLVAAIVDEMIAAIDSKGEALPADQAYQRAKARLDGHSQQYMADMNDADFIASLPSERVEAVRKHLLSQVKQPSFQRQPAAATTAPFKNAEAKPMSIDEAFAERERQLKQSRRKA